MLVVVSGRTDLWSCELQTRSPVHIRALSGTVHVSVEALDKFCDRMDMDSPDKPVEGTKEVNLSSPLENPDTTLFWNKGDQRDLKFMHESEAPNNGMQVYLDQENPVSTVPHVGVENLELESLNMKSISADLSSPANNHEVSFLPIESNLNHQNSVRIDTEDQQFSIDDYQSNAKKAGAEDAVHLTHFGGFLDDSVNETCNNEFHTESSYSLAHSSLLTGDKNNCYQTMKDEASNQQIVEFSLLNEAENGDMEIASVNFQSDRPEIHAEMDGGNLNTCTDTMEDDYSNAIASSENGGMVWENSSLHSPQRPKNASSPERQFYISAERSSHLQPSSQNHPSSQQGELSEANNDNKLAPSPSSSKRKRSPSPDKCNEGSKRRPSSRDHSSSARQRSPSGRTTQRDSHHMNGSPRRHIAHSPRRRDSPRRRSRSSRSPLRSRDSPGRRRDPHRRSRSRSPYARDRYRRSPRRRPSPRHRSPPPSYSRRRSPKRAWSPPANRNTGLGKPGNNLFIAGFSYTTTERDLEKKFSRFGRVTDVRIVRDKRSNESRGFGFLSLERDEDADAAIRALDQTEWNGRIVLVEKSKSSTR